jgi:hypothetical protein
MDFIPRRGEFDDYQPFRHNEAKQWLALIALLIFLVVFL